MTFIEKETIILALSEYKKQQNKKAICEHKKGDYIAESKSRAESNKAEVLIKIFCDILNQPSGTIKI